MKIALLGDIAFLGMYDITQHNNASTKFTYVKSVLEQCDFAIANLECVFTNKTKTHTCKGAYLRSDPKNVELLKLIGITHVTLANNHIRDYGKKGLKDTINALEHANIPYVGINGEPIMLQKGTDKALLEGFCCYSSNGVGYGSKYGKVKTLSFDSVNAFLHTAQANGCLPIVSAHFGIEQVHYPSIEHIGLFRELSKSIPYVLHGNHPHAIQGYETLNKSALFYALGNLCFDTVTETSINEMIKQTERNKKTFCVILDVVENRLVNFEIIPMIEIKNKGLSYCQEVKNELVEYSSKLSDDIEAIKDARKNNLISNRKPTNLNARFVLNRLNYKYIGAYINGKIHAKKYRKLFGEWIK